jgi:asparagine synthase (glutamine-hydrolysing)
MCGICGYVGLDQDISIIRAMVQSIDHRGPDAQDHWADGLVALGHTRLSILDLSAAGNQPMLSRNERFVMVYNGEIYNFQTIRKELESLGHTFTGHSDSEVLLEGFSQWGNDIFPRLNGMFAVAFWDRREETLTLARDPFGIKPLYFAYRPNSSIIFGSEIKAILAAKGDFTKINPQALIEYFFFENPLGRNTFYEGIEYLLPGHILHYADGQYSTQRYWNPLDIEPCNDSEPVAIERIGELFEEAVLAHLVSDVPVGLFLSGGIDSSSIAMIAGRRLGKMLSTFSVDFDFADSSELPLAKKVADVAGTEHHEMRVRADELPSILHQLTLSHDQPFADAANVPLYLLAQAVASKTKVVLQGDGGDEILGGYLRYQRLLLMMNFLRCGGNTLSPVYYSQLYRLLPKRFQKWFRLAFAKDRVERCALMTGKDRNELPWHAFAPTVAEMLSGLDPYQRQRELLAEFNPSMDRLQETLLLDTLVLLPDKFLEKVDKPTMAHSLEVRVPFLDMPFSNYVLSLPSRCKIHKGEKKYLFRKAMRGVVPDFVLDAPKKGFGVPFANWIGTCLREPILDLADSNAVRNMGLFNIQALKKTIELGMRGDRHAATFTWLFYRLADWVQSYPVGL